MTKISLLLAVLCVGCAESAPTAEAPSWIDSAGTVAAAGTLATFGGAPVAGGQAASGASGAPVNAGGAPVCEPGATNACYCAAPFGVGAQQCKPDRSGWGECVCSSGTGGTTSTAGGAKATGGTTGLGGTSASSAGGSAQECKFMAAQLVNNVLTNVALGPCSVYTKGASHCDASGQCVSCATVTVDTRTVTIAGTLDCDHDGTCETDARSSKSCGACGTVCPENQLCRAVQYQTPDGAKLEISYECS